jgi:hypothetical protein
MPLFTKKREIGVQSFILKLVNNNCPELLALMDGPRIDNRVNLTVVVAVVPVEKKKPQIDQAFTAVSKEFSGNGVALVFSEPRGLDHAILGFRFEGQMVFVRAQAKHLNPMGGGFYQLGFRMLEVVSLADYPQLVAVSY